MFVYSVRSQSIKFAVTVILSLAAMITLVALIPVGDVPASTGISYADIYSNSDRIEFLSRFGWEVSDEAISEADIIIPADFDTVYIGYNEMQKEQGLNLTKYRGKEVTQYKYSVKNYPGYEGEVIATLLVYRGKIIGGDISSADASGFVHGFSADEKY